MKHIFRFIKLYPKAIGLLGVQFTFTVGWKDAIALVVTKQTN